MCGTVARRAAEREGINMPVQGGAADIMKVAMLRVHTRLKSQMPDVKMTLQVHDELVLEMPAQEARQAGELVRDSWIISYPRRLQPTLSST